MQNIIHTQPRQLTLCRGKQQTCQNMSVYHLAVCHLNIDLNMAVCHLKRIWNSNQNMSKHSNTACQKCLSKHDTNSVVQSLTPNMPKHVRRPSVKHAKTCQDTICQTCLSKPASNMAVDHLKRDQKLVNSNRACSSVSVDLQRAPTMS